VDAAPHAQQIGASPCSAPPRRGLTAVAITVFRSSARTARPSPCGCSRSAQCALTSRRSNTRA
jgi:hypothetical protein